MSAAAEWDPDGEPDGPGSPDDRYLTRPGEWVAANGWVRFPAADELPDRTPAERQASLDQIIADFLSLAEEPPRPFDPHEVWGHPFFMQDL